MARRSRRSDSIDVALVLIGLAIWLIWYIGARTITALVFVVALIVCLFAIRRATAAYLRRLSDRREAHRQTQAFLEYQRQRREALIAKYRDEAAVSLIMAGSVWHDMSKEQLIDAWGIPDDIETKVTKTKIREIYKFGRTGVNRFQRRAILENDAVVGWEEK
jgi:hypothetical protein